MASENDSSPSAGQFAIGTPSPAPEEKDDMTNSSTPLTDQEQRRCCAGWITIRLAAIIVTGNAPPETWNELGRAFVLLASIGTDETISDAGPEMGALFANLQHSVPLEDTSIKMLSHARELLGRWSEVHETAERQTRPVIDALSRSEIAIVELIGQGHSNKEIARKLGSAPETVKYQIKRIFLKLGAVRRAQAVSRAHALGFMGEKATQLISSRSSKGQ
jgi:DNA-binding CsgD family transcriptional regulator